MSINIGPPAIEELRPRIAVIGVGGAGGNAIANMIRAAIEGVDFIVANTDAQALNTSIAENRLQLGPEITQGLGAGSRPEVGRAAAEETLAEIERLLDGMHMCFIAAGMGGGTGTGAAPVIAQAARAKGVLTVGVVTKPFLFEGTRRMRSAEAGIEELQKHVDTLIVIPNQNLFLVAKAETTFKEAFQLADEVLQQGVRSITDLMVMPGLINLDFADVRSVMAEMGKAMMGTGEGSGENRALEAAEKAIANPLLDGVSMQGAKGVIISIIGGEDMRLLEVDEAANHIRELVDPQANIIWGSAFNPELQGKIRVSVVATGIEQGVHQVDDTPRPFKLSGAHGPALPFSQPGPSASSLPPAPGLAAAVAAAAAAASAPQEDAYDHRPTEHQNDGAEPPIGTPFQSFARVSDSFAAQQSPPVVSFGPLAAGGFSHPPELDFGQEGHGISARGYTPPPVTPQSEELLLDDSHLARPAPMGGHQPLPPAVPPSGVVTSQRLTLAGSGLGGGALGGGGGGGSLFERMANFPGRRKAEEVDHEGEDGGTGAGTINIPRFLGRQNNQ